jgi:ribosomal-protein-alanine N-acetyltransferase
MITTTRLHILPLTEAQLLKYAACDGSLEQELGLHFVERTTSEELAEALRETIIPNVTDPKKNYLFNTLWTAYTIDTKVMVGDLCIVGEPNAEGVIEIGYGTYPQFQGKGYMSEIVSGIISWAKTQEAVKAIIANTSIDNTASLKVLQRNSFINIQIIEEQSLWKLIIKTKNYGNYSSP